MLALHGGAGIVGAPLAGIAAGGMTLAIGQMAFAMTRSAIIRAIVAVLFAVPATLAGYQVVFAMSQIGVPSLVWREIFGAVASGKAGQSSHHPTHDRQPSSAGGR